MMSQVVADMSIVNNNKKKEKNNSKFNHENEQLEINAMHASAFHVYSTYTFLFPFEENIIYWHFI